MLAAYFSYCVVGYSGVTQNQFSMKISDLVSHGHGQWSEVMRLAVELHDLHQLECSDGTG